MSYIGQQLPADVFSGFTIDKFTGDGTANKALTLSEAPFNETAVLVTIDGVVQEPTDDFTVSGTTLTLVGTAANGSEINVTHLSGPVPVTQAASLDLNGASDKLILDAAADTTISADTDDQIDFKAGGTDTMHIIDGKVGIGTATALSELHVQAAATPKITVRSVDGTSASVKLLRVNEDDSSTDFELKNDGGVFKIISDNNSINERPLLNVESSAITFNEGGADVDFRIEGAANANMFVVDAGDDTILIGSNSGVNPATTTGQNHIAISANGSISISKNTTCITTNRTGSEGITMEFRQAGGVRGSISVAGATTAFNTSSDYRLKENVDYTWDGTTILKQLKPAKFNWKVDPDTTIHGFIAHEAKAVVPDSVIGEKDAVDDNGDVAPQQIDQSKLVPILVKTVQELEARIKTLEDA